KSKGIVRLLGCKRPLEKGTFHLPDFPPLITSFFVFLLFLFGCACRRTVIACVVFVRVKGKMHSCRSHSPLTRRRHMHVHNHDKHTHTKQKKNQKQQKNAGISLAAENKWKSKIKRSRLHSPKTARKSC